MKVPEIINKTSVFNYDDGFIFLDPQNAWRNRNVISSTIEMIGPADQINLIHDLFFKTYKASDFKDLYLTTGVYKLLKNIGIAVEKGEIPTPDFKGFHINYLTNLIRLFKDFEIIAPDSDEYESDIRRDLMDCCINNMYIPLVGTNKENDDDGSCSISGKEFPWFSFMNTFVATLPVKHYMNKDEDVLDCTGLTVEVYDGLGSSNGAKDFVFLLSCIFPDLIFYVEGNTGLYINEIHFEGEDRNYHWLPLLYDCIMVRTGCVYTIKDRGLRTYDKHILFLDKRYFFSFPSTGRLEEIVENALQNYEIIIPQSIKDPSILFTPVYKAFLSGFAYCDNDIILNEVQKIIRYIISKDGGDFSVTSMQGQDFYNKDVNALISRKMDYRTDNMVYLPPRLLFEIIDTTVFSTSIASAYEKELNKKLKFTETPIPIDYVKKILYSESTTVFKTFLCNLLNCDIETAKRQLAVITTKNKNLEDSYILNSIFSCLIDLAQVSGDGQESLYQISRMEEELLFDLY